MRHKRAEAASCIYCNPCTLACIVLLVAAKQLYAESQRVYLRLETVGYTYWIWLLLHIAMVTR